LFLPILTLRTIPDEGKSPQKLGDKGMKLHTYFCLLAILFLCFIASCVFPYQQSAQKTHPSSKGRFYPVVGWFHSYNEVLRGQIYEPPFSPGETRVFFKGQITNVTCEGNTYVTYVPKNRLQVNCRGMKGEGHLTCDDGRVFEGSWRATACGKGVGKAYDQNGNKVSFVYGMDDKEGSLYIKSLLTISSSLPDLPPVYKPAETRQKEGFCTGTGFFISENGYIITNYHVVNETDEIIVLTPDGKSFPAEYIEGNTIDDVALLKVAAKTKALPISDLSIPLKGEEVFTIGYPLITIQGQEQKATFGRINSLSGIKGDVRFLQIDVPIQPGNSGGPLLNKSGQVVGVVTATLDQYVALKEAGALHQNVNYALKSDYLIPLIRHSLGKEWIRPKSFSVKKDMPELIKSSESSVVLVIAK
jgi:S1-C subfamily serine protease